MNYDGGRRVHPLSVATTTANNGVTPILNTRSREAPSHTAIGSWRESGKLANWWLVVPYILVTGQPVTLTFQQFINGAWANAVDVPIGFVGGANAIAASATARQGFSLRIYSDVNVFITNGATGPTVLDIGVPYVTNFDPNNI